MGNKKLLVYLDNCCYNRPFNYTEWRRDNLFENMTADELLNESVKYAEMNRPAFKKVNYG